MEPTKTHRRRAARASLAVCIPLVTSGVLAACGTSAATQSNGPVSANCVQQAKAQVAAAKAPVKFTFNGPAFNVSAVRGKTIYWIAVTGDIPFTKAVYAGFAEAAQAAGVKVKFFDGQGQTSEQLRGVEQAVAAKADLIVLQSIPVALMGDGVAAAKRAGIPIVEAFDGDAGAPADPGAAGAVSFAYTQVGKLLAANVAAASGCRANSVVINSSDVPVSVPEVNGIQQGFQALCASTCHTQTQDALIADWSTKVGTLTQTAVADANVNWLIPIYDGMVLFATPAVRQANAAGRVKIASFNASPGIVDDLKNSGSPFSVDIGGPLGWTGWAIADQSLRVLTSQKPVSDEMIPLRIFDQENAKGIDFKGSESGMYGGNYQDEYKKLWGLG